MRVFAALAVTLALGACVEVTSQPDTGLEGGPEATTTAETYTVELFVSEGERLYLITDATDGNRVAARVAGGEGALLDATEARTLLTERQGVITTTSPETVALTLPGLSVRVQADETTGGGDNARVRVDVGGRQFEVNAADASGPEGQENAQVRIGGLTAEEAREFIVSEDEIDPGLQQQMLDALGL